MIFTHSKEFVCVVSLRRIVGSSERIVDHPHPPPTSGPPPTTREKTKDRVDQNSAETDICRMTLPCASIN